MKLIINQIPLEVVNSVIDIYLSESLKLDFMIKDTDRLIEKLHDNETRELINGFTAKKLYYSFDVEETTNVISKQIDLQKVKYFEKPYLEFFIKKILKQSDLILNNNFINEIEVWEKSNETSYRDCIKYRVFNLKITREYGSLGLLISRDAERHIYKKPLSELDGLAITLVKKVLAGKNLYRFYPEPTNSDDSCKYAVLNNSLIKHLGLTKIDNVKTKNVADYTAYYNQINTFYEKYLKGQEATNIKIYASGFQEVYKERITKLDQNKNFLVFGNEKTDVNVYNGISRYGPYRVPSRGNDIRFIFIFHKNDKLFANNLFKYLSKGYKNFPGLKQFVGINFILDSENSIQFENTDNPLPEISNSLSRFNAYPLYKYVAIYISPFNKFVEDDNKRHLYYKIKELLLTKSITSQVIFKDNIFDSSFNFYLPNIAIGLLAKLGGIPWKLKRDSQTFLLLGFGAKKRTDGQQYIGNTICFDNEGLFQEFDAFETNLDGLEAKLLAAIKRYLMIPKNSLQDIKKLVIHYHKDFSNEEAMQVEKVLAKLNLNIPYIVLTINDTKSRDFICFDQDYPGLMPMSGTIVELRKKNLFLLFNNTRYSEYPTTKVDYTYPIKIKISSSKFVDIQSSEVIKELIDEVYQFSRMYWRSIKQKSNPVTIEYSKMIANMVACFKDNKLPDTDTAHKTLWFI